jgi:hypothetical protein
MIAAVATTGGLLVRESMTAVVLLTVSPFWSIFLWEVIVEHDFPMHWSLKLFAIISYFASLGVATTALILQTHGPREPFDFY